jgi:hypothetical protein
VFDEVTRTEGGKRVARRSAFLGSTVAQVLLVAFLVVAGERIRAAVKSDPVVDVKFVRPAAREAAAAAATAAGGQEEAAARTRPQVEVKKAPPMAMIQPEERGGRDRASQSERARGGLRGRRARAWRAASSAGSWAARSPPRAAATRSRSTSRRASSAPQMADKNCFARRASACPRRSPGSSPPSPVEFAVYPNGAVGAFQVMGRSDQRIADAIRNALQNCT